MPRAIRVGFAVAVAIGGVLMILLAWATSNVQTFERFYPALLVVNLLVALALFVFVVVLVRRLARDFRARRFGARLMAKFALAFALLGVVPGVLIYVVSVQFLSRTVESWFDVRVDRALESGLSLGRAALEAQLGDITSKARVIALELADTPPAGRIPVLGRARERAGIDEAVIVSSRGQLIGAAGAVPTLAPDLPSATQTRQALSQRVLALIEGDPLATDAQAGLRTRVIVPIPLFDPGEASGGDTLRQPLSLREESRLRLTNPDEQQLLQLIQRVPPSVAANAQALQSGYRDYQELALSREGLQRIYTVTLTLTLLLAMFAAVASGVLLASSMTVPLLQVAEGTRAVAEGDYRPVREFPGNDELNVLTQSFNAMTRQLTEARDAVEARSRELENARAFLERVLTNLSAGVVVLDKNFRVVSANFGASRILGMDLAGREHERFDALAPALADVVSAAFGELALAVAGDSWQRQIELPRAAADGEQEPLALLARGSRLPLDDGPGYVVVFDDVTAVISGQRARAWGEVARRLAHEIKNPLTPIRLAAERLQMKLADKLPPEQAAILARGAATIVSQVNAMKNMVDDFRKYAAVPPARLAPLDLNALIAEVVQLYGADASSREEPGIRLEIDAQLPMIAADATQLRQVVHNLLVNAQDALTALPAGREPIIVVKTERVQLHDPGAAPAAGAKMTIEDNGPGFAAPILRRAFEPYVTTKASGTGLGLATVKKIVDDHGAHIELANRAGGGAAVIIVFRRLAADLDAEPHRHAA